jgi:hypothetical protein
MRDANTDNLSCGTSLLDMQKNMEKKRFFPKIALKTKITQGGPISKKIQK